MSSLRTAAPTGAIIYNPLTIGPEASVTRAIALMSGGPQGYPLTGDVPQGDSQPPVDDSSCVVVVGADRRVVGIVTERDVVRLCAQQQPLNSLSVAEVMAQPVVTRRQADLTDAMTTLEHLQRERIRHLPIVDEQDRLVGLVTHESLLQVFNPVEGHQRVEGLGQKVRQLEQDPIALVQRQVAALEGPRAEIPQAPQMPGEIDHLLRNFALATTLLLTLKDGQESVQAALAALGSALKADRSYIFENHSHPATGEILLSQRWEWVAEGVTPQINNPDLQNIPFATTIPSWYQSLAQGQTVVGLVKDFPEEEQAHLLPQQILSILLIPIFIEDQFWGLVGFDDCHQERIWEASTQAALQSIAGTIGGAIARRQAEANATRLATRLQEAQRIAKLGAWELNLQTNSLYWSEDVFRIFEIDEPQFGASYTAFLDLVHPEDRALVDEAYTNHLQDRQPYCLVHRLQMPDGRIKYVQEQCETLFWDDGTPLISQGTVQDITEQKEAEIRRDRAEAALRQILEGTAAFTGEAFFPALVRHIAEALGVRYAGVSQATPAGFQPLAFVADGELCPMPILSYEAVPCSTEALTTGDCFHPSNIQALYPDNALIRDLQLDSYLGVGLRNTAGEPIGNLCIFHDAPIADADWAETLLTIFAARAGAELERFITAQALEQLNSKLEYRVAERTATLAERETLLQDFLDNANDLIQMVNIDTGRFEFVNRAWQAVLGYTDDDVAQLTCFDVLATECRGHCQALFTQIRGGDFSHLNQMELIFIGKFGQRVVVEGNVNCRFVTEADGRQRPVSSRGIFRDVTAKKAAERELQRREARYRALMEGASDAILLSNPEGYVIEANQNAGVLLGYDRTELVGMHFSQLHHPEDLPQVGVAFASLANQERCQVLGIDFLRRDGQRVPVDVTASVVEVEGETIIQGIFHDIRERLEAEQALRESEARFRRVFESDVVGMMFTNFSGQIAEANDRFLAMLGYTRQDLEPGSSLNWADLTPPEYQSLDQVAITHLQHHGSIPPWEKAYRHKDGHLVPVLIGVAMLSDEEESCVCVVVDISDRKHYETALKDSQQLLQTVLDTVPLSVFWKDRQSVILGCNQAFANASGVAEPADVIGKGNFDLGFTQAEAEGYTADDRLVMTSGLAKLGIEETVTPAGGEQRWIETNKLPLRDGNGKVIGLVGTFQDITVRKRAEQTIRQQAERETVLREITQRIRQSLDLKTIFDTACEEIRTYLQADRVGIFRFYPDSGHGDSGHGDGEFVAESVLASFSSVLSIRVHNHCFGANYANLDAQGSYFVINDIDHPGLSTCHSNLLAQFQVRATMVMPLLCNGQLWGLLCIHQCGAPRHWHQSEIDLGQQLANQLAIAIQQAILYEQLQTELQERQRAEAQLTLTNTELVRATRLKDEFLANMSHELRTPLNAILGMAEALQDGDVFGPVNAQQVKALQTIERSGTHLLELINDVLDLAKIEAGQMELDLTPTAIAPLCQSSLAFVQHLAAKKGLQLTVHLPADLPTIALDERRMRQVLINLLNNAVKFTPQGGQIALAVTPLPLSPDEDAPAYLRFAVTDTGIGIAPDEQPRLFQPFVQIDSALNRQYQGTGLGLALVKRIVNLHGGQVGLTSNLGVGSCFTIDLPYARGMAISPVTTHAAALEVSSPAAVIAPAPLILLTEDNEANICTMASYLRAKGYRVDIAHNGEEALAHLQHLIPDLILMDIQMPGIDGLEVISHIRRTPHLAAVPVVALTSLAMSGDRDRCLAAGATSYMSKPVRLKHLVDHIQTLLSSDHSPSAPDP